MWDQLDATISDFIVNQLIKGQYLVKNTTDIRIDVIFYD